MGQMIMLCALLPLFVMLYARVKYSGCTTEILAEVYDYDCDCSGDGPPQYYAKCRYEYQSQIYYTHYYGQSFHKLELVKSAYPIGCKVCMYIDPYNPELSASKKKGDTNTGCLTFLVLAAAFGGYLIWKR